MSALSVLYLTGMTVSGAWFLISGQRAGLRIKGSEGLAVFIWPLSVPVHALRLWIKHKIDHDCANGTWEAKAYGAVAGDVYQPARPNFPFSNEQADDWVRRATTP